MDLNEINDTLKAARDYLGCLQKLNLDLEQAEHQIISTANESYQQVEVIFTTIVKNIVDTLNARKEKLLKQILDIKQQGLTPLQDCHHIVADKIQNTSQLINIGTKIVQSRSARDVEDFNNKSRLLGSLPEVPDLKEVPFVYFQYEPSAEDELLDICSSFGVISQIAPVQICSSIERPGSILVEWKAADSDDRSSDIQEFRLQKAHGRINDSLCTNSTSFTDCYIGTENLFLVKYLQCNQEYSFRVCCKYEGSSQWSQWSVPQVALTRIPKYSWRTSADFNFSYENSIAKPLKDSSTVLFSDGAQFNNGYSVEFTFLECDANRSDVYIGLTVCNKEDNILTLKKDSFLLEANGDISINGVTKATKLPEIKQGSKICFTWVSYNDSKLRINVDSNEKRVTYDWIVEENNGIYFTGIFNSSRWKVMVE